ncbi:MAG: aldehyde dehydrogenase family protein [Woeseiaceae bacterium]|jgi:sulfoacetaldehyde dehydrogenase|nr:aldehyde dehydrogenase family protein [Woeseiaceae bacterium]
MQRLITEEEKKLADDMLEKARAAMQAIEHYDQEAVDRLIQAIAWAASNEETTIRLTNMGADESKMGTRVPSKRFHILGILRDALRQKSMGVIEEIPEKGITKYAKPAGVIASLIPVTNPINTPIGLAIFAVKCKDAVIFSPHPRSKETATETVRIMRVALKKQGVPEDLLQCIEQPSIPLTNYLMSICDLTNATGGSAMVKAAYSSGKPAYGVGPGNATMVIDETADIEEAAKNTRISKTNNNGAGCSSDGNLVVDASIYDEFLQQLQNEGGYLASAEEKKLIQAVWWNADGTRIFDTVAQPASLVAEMAGLNLPKDKTFFIVEEDSIGKEHLFSSEKLGTMLAIFKYEGGFENALERVKALYEVGGKGHSCGIYSFDDEHINQLALAVPVSRIMVRQPQSIGNAGSFSNGMPMTGSLGCGVWGGGISSENIALKHYYQTTWVSRPIPEDRPSEEELFGEFYETEIGF